MMVKRSHPGLLLCGMNGHNLWGRRDARGGWRFTCPDFPEIAKQFDGAKDSGPALVAFQRRCLLGGTTARSAKSHA